MSQPIPSDNIGHELTAAALNHLGDVLSMLAELHEDNHCRAYVEAIAFYNAQCPDNKVFPTEGYSSRLVITGPLDRLPVPEDSARKQPITIHIEGGLVQDVTGIPAGYEVRVEDYDHSDMRAKTWDAEKKCHVTVYGGGK